MCLCVYMCVHACVFGVYAYIRILHLHGLGQAKLHACIRYTRTWRNVPPSGLNDLMYVCMHDLGQAKHAAVVFSHCQILLAEFRELIDVE